ncbi:MAG: flavodoxin family protein, partial [Anaerolineaceae bacterium]|nr:flavodoxin family protein [Anaerolineaceae bacterium]
MKAMVIYDSIFGNTEQVARAVAGALGSPEEVSLFKIGTVKPEQLAGLGLLVVGSPTRAFKATPAVTDFLAALPAGALKGVKVAAFDTRISPQDAKNLIYTIVAKLFGFAAKPMAALLGQKGGELTAPGEGFVVKASD